jgi:ornithine decarboxylase
MNNNTQLSLNSSGAHIAPSNNFSILNQIELSISNFQSQIDGDEGFWIADLKRTKEVLQLWEENLPNIQINYAMKCCNEPNLLKYLAKNGIGFDCASKEEIETMIGFGADPSKIVFSHPIKSINSLKYAKSKNVKRVVFENGDELKKIMKYHQDAEVFLRVKPTFSNAKIQLSNKFGANKKEAIELIRLSSEFKANFIGFSFHVGSLCDDINTFRIALEYIHELKEKAEEFDLKVRFIDIGGGFLPQSSKSVFSFSEIADTIKSTIEDLFEKEEIEFIAEPGRLIGNDYMDLYLPVIGVKVTEEDFKEIQHVYIPDGIYGSFNALTYDHAEPHFEINTNGSDADNDLIETILWGQTCDSADIVYVELKWPHLSIGDMIRILKFGAYTYSPSSFFNGFQHHKVFVMNDEEEE